MISDRLRVSPDTRHFYLVLGCLILVAWGLLFAWQTSAHAELLGHESLGHHDFSPAGRLAAFLLSWFLMILAMMLPSSLPLLSHSIQPVWQRPKSRRLVGRIMLGYLSPWALFGLLVYLGDSILHQMAHPFAPLASISDFIAPAIVLIAGLYQFTPVKHSYLERCRPSEAHFLEGWLERLNGARALQQGLRLGVFCLGSCWSLMLLMFALGHNRLDWMLALGGIMALERLSPWGHRLAWLVGFVLVAWATFWLLALYSS
jgi:predicted metal-binding membrane protein